jgi:hypothetical protein
MEVHILVEANRIEKWRWYLNIEKTTFEIYFFYIFNNIFKFLVYVTIHFYYI